MLHSNQDASVFHLCYPEGEEKLDLKMPVFPLNLSLTCIRISNKIVKNGFILNSECNDYEAITV